MKQQQAWRCRSILFSTLCGLGAGSVSAAPLPPQAGGPLKPVLSITGGEVIEGHFGDRALDFHIRLSSRPRGPVTLRYQTVSGTAHEGRDYQPASGTLRFTGQTREATVSVVIHGDLSAEDDEAFELVLSEIAGAAVQSDRATGWIRDDEPIEATRAARAVEPVVLSGAQLPGWAVPAAQGAPHAYPSGAELAAQCGSFGPFASGCQQFVNALQPLRDATGTGAARSAHNGRILYPPSGATGLMGPDVARIAAWRYANGGFVEVPVQVDQRFPYFLANHRSGFSWYSGTDEELSYEWDVERWDDGDPQSTRAAYAGATPDPVTGLDHDDEIVFMAADAGHEAAPPGARPAALDEQLGLWELVLQDPLDPGHRSFLYLGLKPVGQAGRYFGVPHYVRYQREADADEWIDRYAFCDGGAENLGSSNVGYGPNRSGLVAVTAEGCALPASACDDIGVRDPRCAVGGVPNGTPRPSSDRFPRDGVTVTTDRYLWRASGRWMIREIAVARPGQPGAYGPDLIDRWKGRAFQQSPDSTISFVGFEDEQVNWEANSTLLGERCGPVRCIRETWGADSGTNVTKTETFYRGAVTYRYRVRVHPIPPDGLYTSWDYNRAAMLPDPQSEADVPAGRYFTAVRPEGVPIDGHNDDIGNVDAIAGRPAFFDAPDPTLNLPVSSHNWEQVSGKGDAGSLVYLFELKGASSALNPLVVPYYRDDACLDDGTGDDPVPRPWPGEPATDSRVRAGYAQLAGKDYAELQCSEKQGAHGSHGLHFFLTQDSDNSFLLGKPNNEIDGQQWQFMVPTPQPMNVGERYANVVRAPLQVLVRPALP